MTGKKQLDGEPQTLDEVLPTLKGVPSPPRALRLSEKAPSFARLLDAAVRIRQEPAQAELAFLARQFVQATLPHQDPGDVPLWKRINGDLTLAIRPGIDIRTGKSYGYPYGTIPRLLLFWMTTEAVRLKSRRLELGHSLSDFMKQLGLNPNNGSRGAKRSDAHRLSDQMLALFRATISFESGGTNGRKGATWVDMQIAPEGVFWWDEKRPNQGALWGSYVQLGERFYEAITVAPVPTDMRALRALKRSPLALDLYAWATYTAYQTKKSDQSRFVEWMWLHEQFGAEYGRLDNFGKKAKAALRKVKAVYPEFGFVYERGGVRVLPCNPAVTTKANHEPKSANKPYLPRPSAKALATFQRKFPEWDVEPCIDAWHTLLTHERLAPGFPDSHFLRFAEDWVGALR